ncbi:MAG TPA: diguanylate cyclase [Nevskiaceae bacterium]|nr:diguanylate cyclase [Nevskiaceae bacterium]
MKLLLVEDVLAYARALRALLSGGDDGVTVHHVETLGQALAELAREPYDCVLLDLHLPDTEGIEAVDRLRAQDKATALVVLTGIDDRELALEALRRGAQEYAVKGEQEPEDLLRIIRHAIERNRVVAALHEQREREVWAAQHDAVTALPNRMLLAQHARDLLDGAARNGHQGALIYFDLDGFKGVNDLHGHETGDKVLAAVAQGLLESVQMPDLVARVGGDEFVVMLANVADGAEAEAVAGRIVRRVGSLRQIGNATVTIGASAGVALYPLHGERLEDLVSRADTAMYAAKRAGKNTVRVFGARDATYRRSTDPEGGHYSLTYQPWLQTANERVAGIEALLMSPMSGESAAELLDASERRGELGTLGQWVLRRALRQWRDWRDAGFLPARLAINVTAAELRDESFATSRLDVLAELDVPLNVLQLEISEDVLIDADERVLAVLARLRGQGVRIVADNVGRTQASLMRLARIPLDGYKLHLKLVPALARGDRAARAVAIGVIASAEALGIACTAVGVESASDLQACRELGFPYVQGYWVGRPQFGDACVGLRAHT